MTVTELARCAEVTPDTVRHYVRIGLLKPMRHRNNGYKLFTENDLDKLHFIRKARNLGYHLSEIAEILSEACQGRSPCPRVRDIIRKRIVENRCKLDEMLALQVRMEQALSVWEELPDGVPDGRLVCHLINADY
jgi:DNA-binding transcriptional MerR regulator